MSTPTPRAPMLATADALATLLSAASPMAGTESIPTLQALNRVLSADVTSPLDVPPMNTSAMDGYAIRTADMARAGNTDLAGVATHSRGPRAQPLTPGTAARIFTGATVPPGADAIVIQEQTEIAGDRRHDSAHPASRRMDHGPGRGHPQWFGHPACGYAADAAGVGARCVGWLRGTRGAAARQGRCVSLPATN